MRKSSLAVVAGLFLAGMFFLIGCETGYKGEYRETSEVILLDDKYSDVDLNLIAEKLVRELVTSSYMSQVANPPIVIMGKISNRTSEHIDMKSLGDKIRTGLINTGKVKFLSKEMRADVAAEIAYQHGGNVDPATAKRLGEQTGADHILYGSMADISKSRGDEKLVYYKITLNLVDLTTTLIDWAGEQEIKKKFKRVNVGL